MSILEMQNESVREIPKSIERKSSPEHYKAEACVVWCFDARFAELYDDFLKERGLSKSKVDSVVRAGGAKSLAMEDGFRKEDTMDEIGLSIKLHGAERVILMVHMDCGGYGGSKAFDNDREKEWGHHVAELKKAADTVLADFPAITDVECHIADFEGVHLVDSMSRPKEEVLAEAA